MLRSIPLPRSWLVAFLIGVLTPSGLLADSITLAATADTTLFQAAVSNNLGSEVTVISGTTGDGQRNRALFKFDIAGNLPANATIQSVSLALIVTETFAGEATLFSLHRVLAPWGEGAGAGASEGAPAASGDATWLARSYPGVLWSVPGAAAPGDFVTAASATQSLLGAGSYTFDSSPGLVADVQSWIDGSSDNFGWILVCEDEFSLDSSRWFGSREDPANAPALQIEYTVPPRPSITLPPVADTSLFAYNPDGNLGRSSLVAGSIGANGGGQASRALIRFNLHDLPANAVITSATLNLNVVHLAEAAANSTFDLHRLLQPWGEGQGISPRGDSAAAPGDATWNARSFPSTLWSAPGAAAPADFSATVSSSALVADFGPYWFSNLVADVQFWADHPGQNYGWIVISESESTPYTARRFGSREDPPNAPVLKVEYIPKPRIDSGQVNGNQFTLSFAVLAGLSSLVQSLDSLSHTNWAILTNFPARLVPQTNAVSTPLTGSQHYYRIGFQ